MEQVSGISDRHLKLQPCSRNFEYPFRNTEHASGILERRLKLQTMLMELQTPCL